MRLKPFATCFCQVASLFIIIILLSFYFFTQKEKDDFGGNLKLGYDKMDKLKANYGIWSLKWNEWMSSLNGKINIDWDDWVSSKKWHY